MKEKQRNPVTKTWRPDCCWALAIVFSRGLQCTALYSTVQHCCHLWNYTALLCSCTTVQYSTVGLFYNGTVQHCWVIVTNVHHCCISVQLNITVVLLYTCTSVHCLVGAKHCCFSVQLHTTVAFNCTALNTTVQYTSLFQSLIHNIIVNTKEAFWDKNKEVHWLTIDYSSECRKVGKIVIPTIFILYGCVQFTKLISQNLLAS